MDEQSTPLRLWQEKRSADTRKTILDAAKRCLIDVGYIKSSVPFIAEVACMSRGAILHHFPTRDSLIEALITDLHQTRMENFIRLFQDQRQPHNKEEAFEQHRRSIQAAWTHFNHEWYIAYQELLSAARTDKDLWAIMAPLEKEHSVKFDQLIGEWFPKWRARHGYQLGLDLTQFLMRGMLSVPMDDDQQQRQDHVLNKLAEILQLMYESEDLPLSVKPQGTV